MKPDKEEATRASGKRQPDESSETKQPPSTNGQSSGFDRKSKTSALSVGDDLDNARAVGWLHQLYREAQQGLRKVVAVGLCCYQIKARLPHGQFQNWLAQNCPGISYRSLAAYMQLTANVLEVGGFNINGFLSKVQHCTFAHPGELLLLEDGKIPDDVRPVREKICSLIDGKSARQLFLEFKTADDANGEVVVRAPGGDGAWEKWVREKHPEIVADGKVPGRQHVPKALRNEFDAFLTERQRRNHDPLAEAKAKQQFAEDLWNSLAQSLWTSRDKLHLLSDRVREQVLEACVDTSNAIREMKGGHRPTTRPSPKPTTKGKR